MLPVEKINGRRIAWYIGLTFVLTYLMWGILALNPGGLLPLSGVPGFIIFTIGCNAPPIVVLILLLKWREIAGLKEYFKRVVHAEYGARRAIWVTVLFFLVEIGLVAVIEKRTAQPLYMFVPVFLLTVMGGGLEEIGWRGFLLRGMEKKLPFWLAALAVGLIWALWHIPLWFIAGTSNSTFSYLYFSLFCVTNGYVLAALRRISGSVLPCILFHMLLDTLGSYFMITDVFLGENMPLLLAYVLQAVLAVALVYLLKRKPQ